MKSKRFAACERRSLVGLSVALVLSGAASAQQLEEVVVTATRQTSTVDRVPLSIAAVTDEAITQTGVKDMQALSRTVPSVTFRRIGNAETASIAIRGIVSTLGAPTTAVYLDDTPLHKREGTTGTPFPQLFDLERVEVLRGPQGTLYGGSAQGGAIRLISREPSLTDYSGTARTEVSYTEGGDPSYEGGAAVGGPLVEDKLGFRASVWYRNTGGYMDHVSVYDGHTVAENTNDTKSMAGRVALAWQATENLRLTPALYASRDDSSDNNVFWEDIPRHTVNAGFFTNRGSVNGVTFDFPDRFYPGGTFGPWEFGPGTNGYAYYRDEAGNAQLLTSPRDQQIILPSLTLDYAWGGIDVKSISSYVSDVSRATFLRFGIRSQVVVPISTNAGFVTPASHTAENVGTAVPGGAGNLPLIIPGFPQQYNSSGGNDSTRKAFTQEIRFSSAPAEDKRLSWVAGLYYTEADYEAASFGTGINATSAMSVAIRGVPEEWFFGALPCPQGEFTCAVTTFKEREQAVFGEANYLLTDRLTLIAGLRLARVELEQYQANAGVGTGAPPGFVGSPLPPAVVTNPAATTPFPAVGTFRVTTGESLDEPVNPKLGLSWQATDRHLFYATAAKGYRGGGANAPINPVNCAADLAALGLTGIGTPLSYDADAVWSYEAGAKVRLFGMQVNASAFFIDWEDPQVAVRLRCAHTYITNGGKAASKGVDLQVQAQPLTGLTLQGSVSYTDARYTETFALPLPGGAQSIIVAEDDPLGVPEWQANVGAEYAFDLGTLPAFIRADYQYSGEYERGVRPGRAGYNPLTFEGDATRFLSARAGVSFDTWDLALYGNNLTNSDDRLYESNLSGQQLIEASTFRPREIGLQLNFRFD